jgi:hypothetical protein
MVMLSTGSTQPSGHQRSGKQVESAGGKAPEKATNVTKTKPASGPKPIGFSRPPTQPSALKAGTNNPHGGTLRQGRIGR